MAFIAFKSVKIVGNAGMICGVAGFLYIGLPLSLSATTKLPLAALSGSSGIEHLLTTLSMVSMQNIKLDRFTAKGSAGPSSIGG